MKDHLVLFRALKTHCQVLWNCEWTEILTVWHCQHDLTEWMVEESWFSRENHVHCLYSSNSTEHYFLTQGQSFMFPSSWARILQTRLLLVNEVGKSLHVVRWVYHNIYDRITMNSTWNKLFYSRPNYIILDKESSLRNHQIISLMNLWKS